MKDKFVVSRLRGEDGTTVVTARLPDRIVQRLDEVVAKVGRSRTQIMIMAIEYALDRLVIEDNDE